MNQEKINLSLLQEALETGTINMDNVLEHIMASKIEKVKKREFGNIVSKRYTIISFERIIY